jgi:nitrite reductase/ring-hydroxylating ferredoxin subunit
VRAPEDYRHELGRNELGAMSLGPDWYGVAVSEGLEPGTSAGTRLFDKEIVVWRDSDGAAHAWEDRCPHRGMRLSFGFVRGDRIACLYHGWQYDAAGRCRYIPAHPDLKVPETICVTTYPCRERLGMVWVYSELESKALPDLPSERPQVTPVRSIYIDRSPGAVLECLMAADLPSFPSAAAGARPVVVRWRSLLSLTFGGVEVLAAVQPVSDAKTALHLAVAGRPEDWRGAGQKKVARWAEELRRDLEARSLAPVAPAKVTREMAP